VGEKSGEQGRKAGKKKIESIHPSFWRMRTVEMVRVSDDYRGHRKEMRGKSGDIIKRGIRRRPAGWRDDSWISNPHLSKKRKPAWTAFRRRLGGPGLGGSEKGRSVLGGRYTIFLA